MISPFDFLNEINYGKHNIMRGTTNTDAIEKMYSPFIANKTLSYFADTILFANEMNIRVIDNSMQFAYLLNVVRQKKRYTKWEKREKSDKISLIQKHYKYSYKKAKDVVKLLSDDQFKLISNLYYEGGQNGH